MLPGTGGKENAGGMGMIQAPAPMQPLPEKTPSRRHGHGEHHHHSRSSRHGKEEQYGSLPHGVPPYNEAQQTPALDLPKFAGRPVSRRHRAAASQEMEGGRRGGIRCRWRWSERWLLAMIVWIEERVEREMPIQSMCARVERQAN